MSAPRTVNVALLLWQRHQRALPVLGRRQCVRDQRSELADAAEEPAGVQVARVALVIKDRVLRTNNE